MLEDYIIDRALKAYYRHNIGNMEQPAMSASSVVAIEGIPHVVLRNAHRTLAVYRLGATNLQRLDDVPAVLVA